MNVRKHRCPKAKPQTSSLSRNHDHAGISTARRMTIEMVGDRHSSLNDMFLLVGPSARDAEYKGER